MISATDLKHGIAFLDDDRPLQVIKYNHQKIGRGGGTVKLTVRDLQTGNLIDKTYPSSYKFDEASTTKKPYQYLYSDGEKAYFMDPSSYEQIEIEKFLLSEQLRFIKEGSQVNILFWENRPLSIDIPPKVNLKVVDTAPGVKGNSATNIYKPATLENGLSLRVPLFIKIGDEIKVDTRTSEYVERVTS